MQVGVAALLDDEKMSFQSKASRAIPSVREDYFWLGAVLPTHI